jgi:hypothetical protein
LIPTNFSINCENYHREIKRSQGDISESVKKLLPRLRDENETEVFIITAGGRFEARRFADNQ